ncbi:hypothetical protein M9458_019332, partial [Cirrhinus mrigala]
FEEVHAQRSPGQAHKDAPEQEGVGGAMSSDNIITTGGTTLILTNIQPGTMQGLATVNATVNTSGSQDQMTTAEIPLQLVSV